MDFISSTVTRYLQHNFFTGALLTFVYILQILHRDMKAANVLITKTGILKLADFGLARAFSVSKSNQGNRYTNRVVTLWYRPPELLLGERNYGPPVDMWGAGCIMAEMWTRSPIMQGNTEQHQLTLICQLCGSITTEVWPEVDKLDLFTKMELPKGQKRKVKGSCKICCCGEHEVNYFLFLWVERLKPYVKDPYACDLLDRLLTLDPSKRIDADTSLNHDFFWTDPMPCDLGKMLGTHNQSMFEFLAPPRRPGRVGQPLPGALPQPKPNPAADSSYHDRVF